MAEPAAPVPAAPAPAAPPPGPRPVKCRIDGREVEAPAGTSILEAARSLGIEVPVFCYHPGLPVAGNCRMCMVEASNSKKPVISCATPIAEGLEVKTGSEMARKARAGVLELMLINHPLDCPICDKSGECMLQDNSYDHGKPVSRMVEAKETKHTKQLGSTIWIWGNRCIVCTRCTRFCDEVAGTGELCVVERGDHSVIDVFPGRPIENSLAGNVIDICPVGALISRDFLYQARVWNAKKTETICAGCSRGCNIEAQTLSNRIVRLVPRENRAVNDWWMCDHGRYGWKHVQSPDRVLASSIAGAPAVTEGKLLAERLGKVAAASGPRSVAGLASAFMTLEELHLFRKVLATLGSDRLGALARPEGREERFKGGFVIAADKNPDREGARRVLGGDPFGAGREAVLRGIESGEVRGLLLVSDLPGCPLDERLVALLGRLEFLAVFLLEADPRLPASALVIPASTFAEKDGTMLNDRGRLQRLRPALALPRASRPELDVLQEALAALGERRQAVSAGGVFRELGRGPLPELEGLTHRDLGTKGLDLAARAALNGKSGPAGGGA